jgi:hypothetical protein
MRVLRSGGRGATKIRSIFHQGRHSCEAVNYQLHKKVKNQRTRFLPCSFPSIVMRSRRHQSTEFPTVWGFPDAVALDPVYECLAADVEVTGRASLVPIAPIKSPQDELLFYRF